MIKFYRELKRRNVIKAGISFIIAAWAIIQASDIIFPILGLGEDALKYEFIALVVAFPLWVIFAYIFEWTPQGFKKTENVSPEKSMSDSTNKFFNKVIVATLSLVVILLLADKIFDLTGPVVVKEKSIAVLPFDNIGDAENEYFAIGVSEDILTQIAKIKDLRVLSQFTMKDFDYSGKSVEQIGNELGVNYLLTGNVRRAGNTLRISCHLIQVRPEEETWANNFDKELSDVFAIQAEVAKEVASSLQTELSIQEVERIDNKPTENLEAYSLYLQAKSFYDNANDKDNELAIKYFSEALVLDSTFSAAKAGLINAYSRSISNFGTRSYAFFDSTFQMAKSALEQNPESSELKESMAYQHLVKGNYEKAILLSEDALKINPNSSRSYNMLGLLYRNAGRIDEALESFKRGLALEPTKIEVYYYNIGSCYEILGFYDEALSYYNEVLDRDQSTLITLERIGAIGLMTKDKDISQKAINGLLAGDTTTKALNISIYLGIHSGLPLNQVSPLVNSLFKQENFNYLDNTFSLMAWAQALKEVNLLDSMNQMLGKTEQAYINGWGLEHDDGDVLSTYVGIAMLRGDQEKALEWVQKVVDTGSLWAFQAIKLESFNQPLLEDPRFIEIVSPLQNKLEKLRLKVSASEQTFTSF